MVFIKKKRFNLMKKLKPKKIIYLTNATKNNEII